MGRRTFDQRHSALKSKIELFCAARHGLSGGELCDECIDLVVYARERVERCPHDPKPMCKDCRTHCYGVGYRDRIRAVMRFAGARRVGDGDGGSGDTSVAAARSIGYGQGVDHG